MTPRELIEKWIEIFNEGNADKIMELYHTDAINHQVANPPVKEKKLSEQCLLLSLALLI